jgi:hypothetical protein
VIDCNTSCIRILEPIAEEINQLKSLEEKGANSPRFALQVQQPHSSHHIVIATTIDVDVDVDFMITLILFV